MKVDNFYNFNQYSGIEKGGIFSSLEERYISDYSLDEFKEIVKWDLYESDGYVDDYLVESAYAYYEISNLAESKWPWLNDDGDAFIVEADEHIIVIKNNEPYIISKSTFYKINEASSFERARKSFNSLRSKASNKIKSTIEAGGDMAKSAWDKMSDGAKKAWEFVKTLPSAAKRMIKEMTWKDWTSQALGVISALCGILGAGIPGVTILAGVTMALSGGMQLYDGWEKYTEAKDALVKLDDVGKFAKQTKLIASALPAAALGTLFMSMGFYEISQGVTSALANPAAGSVALKVKSAAERASNSVVSNFSNNIQKNVSGYSETAVKLLSKRISGDKAANAGMYLLTSFGQLVMTKTIDFIWKTLMKLGKGILKGVSFLLDIPGRITAGISSIQKNAKTSTQKIIASGLGNLVKPLSVSASNAISKHIKPFIKSATNWIEFQIKSYDVCQQAIEKHKSDLDGIGEKVKPSKPKPIIKFNPPKSNPRDVKLVKKIEKATGGKKSIKNKTINKTNQRDKGDKKLKESESYYKLISFDEFLKN
jgi:hypothetical protein